MDPLTYLLQAYFHEDWSHTFQTWEEILDEFLKEDSTLIARVPEEIDTLLARIGDDAELERTLMSMGLAYDPDEGDRAWLEAVRDRIVSSLR
ncbi:contact-dependent growth inhibition system immunity protein [Nocardioides houyundeii]|uniref:contact-dependent growth inhibition system immunity protein n=1 Tax=Nocardioides houyundeii TaxID=2045452 RepID=UPI000DF1B567|nr:contact-dependent growth inhibition system immunity protein [Nocardioides houyundeii]